MKKWREVLILSTCWLFGTFSFGAIGMPETIDVSNMENYASATSTIHKSDIPTTGLSLLDATINYQNEGKYLYKVDTNESKHDDMDDCGYKGEVNIEVQDDKEELNVEEESVKEDSNVEVTVEDVVNTTEIVVEEKEKKKEENTTKKSEKKQEKATKEEKSSTKGNKKEEKKETNSMTLDYTYPETVHRNELPKMKMNKSYAKITWPSLKYNKVPITWGFDQSIIDNNEIGQSQSTSMFGENSSIILAGHNNKTFVNLKNADIGDRFKVETTYGTFYYEVYYTGIGYVSKDGTNIISEDEGDELLTYNQGYEDVQIFTCYEWEGEKPTKHRFVVRAKKICGTTIVD